MPTGASPAPRSAWAEALLAAAVLAVDPSGLGGLRLRARPGPVRDRWLEELAHCLGPAVSIRRIAASVSDDRLLGGLDLARTMVLGRPIVEPGVLAAVDGGVLLLGMAERLSPSGVASIKESTRLKIQEAARMLNYVPNSLASSLTNNRSKMVALIVGTLANPFYVHTFAAFSQELQKRGRQTLTFMLDDTMQTDEAILKVLQYQVEAVILTSAQLSTRMINLCHDRGIPLVLFNRYLPHSGVYGVRCDNVAGGRMIADAFLAASATSFMMITGDPNGTTSHDRVRGFVDRLLEAGIRRDAIVEYPGRSSYEGGAAAVDMHMETGREIPDAIFGIADIMVMGAMDRLRARYGKRVPEDVMVAGFDGIPEGGRPAYLLTTVRQPIAEMVSATLAVLHLDEPNEPYDLARDHPIPGEMIWRSTVPHLST